MKIVVSQKTNNSGLAGPSPAPNSSTPAHGDALTVENHNLMQVDASPAPKSSHESSSASTKASLYDMRSMIATSYDFERRQHASAASSKLLTGEELERQASAKKNLAALTSLESAIRNPVTGFSMSHEGYLTYVTRILMEEEADESKRHFFTSGLTESQIRQRYFEPTSMTTALAAAIQSRPIDDDIIDYWTHSGTMTSDDVAGGKSTHPSTSGSVLRRLDEIYDFLDEEIEENDLQVLIRANKLEERVKAVKKRQRPAAFPAPHYTSTDASSASVKSSSTLDSNSSAPTSSNIFTAPPTPAFLRGPATKKRRLYIEGCAPVVEYHFVDTELPDEEETDGAGVGASRNRNWMLIIKRDIPRIGRIQLENIQIRRENAHTLAKAAAAYVQARVERVKELAAQSQHRAKSLSKSIYSFVRSNEKEWKKQAERDAEASRRAVQESEEKERTAKKLNFLITQTELYSHFMSKKLGIEDAEEEMHKINAEEPAPNPDDPEAEQLARARREALAAYQAQRAKVASFDQQSAKMRSPSSNLSGHRKTGGVVANAAPMSGATASASGMVEQPRDLACTLKPYQVKGLNWLTNLYEQGINGILADEMGLGKTVQTISLLAHLAETRGIWGPFLVISPTSTLPNWANEIARFYPSFKVLPYYGIAKQRASLRKLLSPNYLHREDSPVHIVVTSYNLVVQDEKYISRIHWEYMILDEAHAIKSASSVRWQTLLSFGQTRNRLLLTGTPIQNNMGELWALLHFIMPTLFDSHNEFAEWFSKDIEDHVAGASTLNEHQLNRLHMILKPFMLRRVKIDVQNELPSKTEILVSCELTARQRSLYSGIRKRLSIDELFDRLSLSNNNNRASDKTQTKTLMNIVMQFRNVCNHPEIIDKSQTESPVQFGPLPPPILAYSTIIASANESHLDLTIPRLFYRDLFFESPEGGLDAGQSIRRKWLQSRFNIYAQEHIHGSIFGGRFESGERRRQANLNSMDEDSIIPPKVLYKPDADHAWDFVRLSDYTPAEVDWLASANPIFRWFAELGQADRNLQLAYECTAGEEDPTIIRPLQRKKNMLRIVPVDSPVASHKAASWDVINDLVCLEPERRLDDNASLLVHTQGMFHPLVWSATPTMYCSDRRFHSYQSQFQSNNFVTQLLLGSARSNDGPEFLCRSVSSVRLRQPTPGIARPLLNLFGSSSIRVPRYADLVRDSGKLKKLDSLLKDLKRGGHRVLVYSQFTEVLDLLEDFMCVRGHKTVRLDGSSKLDERRDVVDAFQTDPTIFVFLLSTRAGGLGINLTAADTVVFYDSDWNPTMDAQAMDRAHRLGQTRPVTVYRLITRNSVEERILQRAKQKGAIQNLVIQGGRFNLSPEDADDIFKATEMMDLLLEDDETGAVGDKPKKKTTIINPIKMGMKRSSKPVKPASRPGPATLTMDERIEPAEPKPNATSNRSSPVKPAVPSAPIPETSTMDMDD